MTKTVEFHIAPRGPFSDTMYTIDKILVEWDWQSEIRPLVDQVIELKKQEGQIITGNADYSPYPGLCGYLQALVGILGSKNPKDVVTWLQEEKTKLETEMPFLALQHSGKGQ